MYNRPKILVVDHNVDNCEMLPIWLDRNQDRYDVTTIYTCREARDAVVTQHFDICILDYLMPDMTGADLCAAIRRRDRSVPIIIYTGMNTQEVRANCIRSGADLVLLKPDDMDRLAPSVEELLSRRPRTSLYRPPNRFVPRSII